MIILGLAGQAGVGKDTVADYLVSHYGFLKFAFSDALYFEVQMAYNLPDQELLRNRATKDRAAPELALRNCSDSAFVLVARRVMADQYPDTFFPLDDQSLSPRQILQWWGTEYRRAQKPNYWLIKSEEWLWAVHASVPFPEQRPQYFVNTTVRFENERQWISRDVDAAWGGNIWHIRRDGAATVNPHVSETVLPVLEGERELYNNDTIERLHTGIDLLMTTGAKFVKVQRKPYTEEAE